MPIAYKTIEEHILPMANDLLTVFNEDDADAEGEHSFIDNT